MCDSIGSKTALHDASCFREMGQEFGMGALAWTRAFVLLILAIGRQVEQFHQCMFLHVTRATVQ
jgi:hypothetical protein